MPSASDPAGRAEDVHLILQAMACPAFRFGHISYGGHGLRWLAARRNRTQASGPAAEPAQGAPRGDEPGAEQ
jgi:hypothetical protein